MKNNSQDLSKSTGFSLWVSRILILIVFTLNLSCSIQFLLQPATYAPSFNLIGETGIIVIESIGILFLMWNVPYAIAIIHPARYFVALLSAVIMQGIGVLGESWIFINIQSLPTAKLSIQRFIVFDAAGFILLLAALSIMFRMRKNG